MDQNCLGRGLNTSGVLFENVDLISEELDGVCNGGSVIDCSNIYLRVRWRLFCDNNRFRFRFVDDDDVT